eukprot:TRINITY_DN16269_c0_g1_i1.p1 TRINITY_DN16269_c0_g1~~TRINITY_DN16269_c0_g1_i1.p1  ORF type:complete len:237 (+),score=22.76 TRINITY_DN16269_c0_g1_i1:57-713(+)
MKFRLPRAVLRPGYELSPGTYRAELWRNYLPSTMLPKFMLMLSSKRVYKFLYNQMKRTKHLGEERAELAMCNMKFFRGNPWLVRESSARAFPTLVLNGGEFSPKAEMVILIGHRANMEGLDETIDEWKRIWDAKATVIMMDDSLVGCILPESDPVKGTLFASSSDNSPVWDQLAFKNNSIPFVFLVDSKGLLRWQSCGRPTEDEEKMIASFKEFIVSG